MKYRYENRLFSYGAGLLWATPLSKRDESHALTGGACNATGSAR